MVITMSKFDFLTDGSTGIEEFMAKQEKYKDLKKDDLDSIPKDEFVFAVTCWIEGKFTADWSDMCSVINSLPTPCLNVFCADYVTKEIVNGGFAQAFFNTSRDFIGAGAEGLRALGYGEPAEVIERGLKMNFDSGKKPAGRSLAEFLAFSESGDYDGLDKDFGNVFDGEKFSALAYDYIMKYRKYFGD